MNKLEWALQYARLGWKIYPLIPDGKIPLIKKEKGGRGLNDATDNPEQIKKWWGQYPDANIALATGKTSGVWVLDFDTYKDKNKNTIKEFESIYGKLPATFVQRSARGGVHYFFKYNGDRVKSCSSQIFPNVDIRGDGGSVVLTPSTFEGKPYKVDKGTPQNIASAPEALNQAVRSLSQPKKPSAPSVSGATSRYGQAALLEEIRRLKSATPNCNRNETLNKCAFAVGQLIAGGEVDELEAITSLTTAASLIGLETREIKATIESGKNSGARQPRKAPELPAKKDPRKDIEYILDDEDGSQQCQQCQQSQHESAESAGSSAVSSMSAACQQEDQMRQQCQQESDNKSLQNLTAVIEEWIGNSPGSFTTAQLDSDLCLTTRREKNARAKALQRIEEKKKIKKDKRRRGTYYVIEDDTPFFNVQTASGEPFELNLFLGLTGKVFIPKKGIIILAGVSNAGKTLLALHLVMLNLHMPYKIMYLMSEMGPGLYRRRLEKLGVDLKRWDEKVMSAERSYDFATLIERFNPDGLNVIDFLEEKEGEFFMIPSYIRDIYDALGDGVAFICIQKRSGAKYAKGGEMTREKACLYMRLDKICALEDESGECESVFAALQLDKVKESLQGGMQDKEIHFRIDGGSKIEEVMGWRYSSKVDRDECARRYERMNRVYQDYIPIRFNTVEGKTVELTRAKYESWKMYFKKYPRFRFDERLKKIAEMSRGAPWLKAEGGAWIKMLENQLEKYAKEKE